MATVRQAITDEDPAPSFIERYNHEGGYRRAKNASRSFSLNLTMGSQWIGPCMTIKMMTPWLTQHWVTSLSKSSTMAYSTNQSLKWD